MRFIYVSCFSVMRFTIIQLLYSFHRIFVNTACVSTFATRPNIFSPDLTRGRVDSALHFMHNIQNDYDGYDHRPMNETVGTNISTIREWFRKIELLAVLENANIPVHTKMRLLDSAEIRAPNIFAGGLMRDFVVFADLRRKE